MSFSNTILSVSHLQIAFGGSDAFTAVNDISFRLERGKTLAIVGESGSGKSLTALALTGLLPHTAMLKGNIDLTIANKKVPLQNITDNKQWESIRGKEIGMVFQEPMSSLNPVMTIGKQLVESITTHKHISKKEAKYIALDWLTKVQLPEPEKLFGRYPHQLSGGQKQRVMIAMAMCNHPVLLIADEPTTALDVTVQQEIVKLMHSLLQGNTSMIFITHDLSLAATLADDVLVMCKGEVMEYGTTEQVLKSPKNPYTQALVACRPSGEQRGYKLLIVSDFLDADTSRTIEQITHTPLPSGNIGDEVLLQVSDLKVWFSGNKPMFGKPVEDFKAVDEVSFNLYKGEILGLVGESGCGKSTLSLSLMGLIPIHSGQVLFNGTDLATLQPKGWTQIRTRVQMIFQDPYASLNPRMTIGDGLTEPMRAHNIVPNKELKQEAKRLLDLVHLPVDALKRYPHQFSGGQRQRIGIARALALRPQLLICDESVSALDVSVQAQILNLLKELQQEFQLSYLFISHDLSVVHYMSDWVMVMQQGKIVENGHAEQVLRNPKNDYTKRLINAMPAIK